MFRKACKDETLMPPRCCNPIQLSSALPDLTEEEVELFKLKYEEWSTPNRVYCPIKTCSAFIPKKHIERLWTYGYPLAERIEGRLCCTACHEELKPQETEVSGDESHMSDEDTQHNHQSTTSAKGKEREAELHSDKSYERNTVRQCTLHAAHYVQGAPTEGGFLDETADGTTALYFIESVNHIWALLRWPRKERDAELESGSEQLFPCSSCKAVICRRCNQLGHTRSQKCGIPRDDELEAHLKKWKIKRCPKCGQGIRWMYGCHHIKCRCGANWCWFCRLPIEQCYKRNCTSRGRQETRMVEEEFDLSYGQADAMGGRDEEDLDRGWDWADRDLDFGEEPKGTGHGWGCQHRWVVTKESGICHNCFEIIPASGTGPKSATTDDIGEGSTAEANNAPHQGGVGGGPSGGVGRVYQCVNCRMLSCNECRRVKDNKAI